MQPSISFRPLKRSDFPLLQIWLSAPHVATWWNDRADLAGIEARYGPRIDGAEPTHVFLMEQQATPIGWIQWYLWADYPMHARQLGADHRSAGIDLAIGEPDLTGSGLGPRIISEFLNQIVFSNPLILSVITDPDETNVRSLRAFQKAGFRSVKTVRLDGEDGKRTVMRLDRAGLLKE